MSRRKAVTLAEDRAERMKDPAFAAAYCRQRRVSNAGNAPFSKPGKWIHERDVARDVRAERRRIRNAIRAIRQVWRDRMNQQSGAEFEASSRAFYAADDCVKACAATRKRQ